MYHYPCKGCTERYVKVEDGKLIRCHTNCEKYKAARAEHTEQTDKEKEIRYAESDAEQYLNENYNQGAAERWVVCRKDIDRACQTENQRLQTVSENGR